MKKLILILLCSTISLSATSTSSKLNNLMNAVTAMKAENDAKQAQVAELLNKLSLAQQETALKQELQELLSRKEEALKQAKNDLVTVHRTQDQAVAQMISVTAVLRDLVADMKQIAADFKAMMDIPAKILGVTNEATH